MLHDQKGFCETLKFDDTKFHHVRLNKFQHANEGLSIRRVSVRRLSYLVTFGILYEAHPLKG